MAITSGDLKEKKKMSLSYSDCECGGKCEKCKKKQAMMAIGYSESAAELIVEQAFK